jgi:hypothetical protein
MPHFQIHIEDTPFELLVSFAVCKYPNVSAYLLDTYILSTFPDAIVNLKDRQI